MDDALRNALFNLLAPPNIEATIDSLVNTCALAVAGKPDDIRGGAVAWLRREVVENLSELEEFRSKNLDPIADLLAARLEERIKEIVAVRSGRA